MKIISVDADAKTKKSNKLGEFLTGIIYLAPHKISGKNLCAYASPSCIKSCLYTSGHGAFSNVQQARINKTLFFLNDRDGFLNQLHKEINSLKKKANKLGVKLAIRLNGTSDIPWEHFNVIQQHPDVQFYDYTKNYRRIHKFLDGDLPENYFLIFSRSETTPEKTINGIVKNNGNVAVVFRNQLPDTYLGFPVINGDLHDLRFQDQSGVIVGLVAKGQAKKESDGFVVNN